MTRRMLIDATEPQEMRVAVVNGTKLEEFDYETEFRKQLKGNIYLAKVTRVEPSLQAAFVEYGGNRHAFLPFPEIHSDYYRIPVGDRPHGYDEDEADEDQSSHSALPMGSEPMLTENDSQPDAISQAFESVRQSYESEDRAQEEEVRGSAGNVTEGDFQYGEESFSSHDEASKPVHEGQHEHASETQAQADDQPKVEIVGGDEVEEMQHRRRSVMPRYKIQEVIKRRQIMLIQIAKEERGNKGAAVTTFLSLPGRYCVLMPNTPRGGGVSRKIANPQDRKRMKDLIGGLELPPGMSVILRTAGVERTQGEIKRDLDYLLRLWETIRDLTLQSTAPALVYEEGNLIKRSIRDIYGKDISEILVAGEQGYRQAKDFMRMLMPAHARRVQYYRETVPLFFRYQVESQIDSITDPVAQLRSGGYIVINQTEALVSIDVNSGRSTRERNIEETAYKTNLEAAEEIARQLRLRDMGGLIVIDFIDMEDQRHDNAVERRLKEAMRHDRARIQIGRVSAFGLLELSRQRLHPSLLESNFHSCAACRGTGIVRSLESAAFVALRAIEEEGIKAKSAEIAFHVHPAVAMHVLNNKRRNLTTLEEQYALKITIETDPSMISSDFRIERLRAHVPGFVPPIMSQPLPPIIEEEDPLIEEIAETEENFEGSEDFEGEQTGGPRRGSRRRRGRSSSSKRGGGERGSETGDAGFGGTENGGEGEAVSQPPADQPDFTYPAEALPGAETAESRGRRRRGRRGGRRRHGEAEQAFDHAAGEQAPGDQMPGDQMPGDQAHHSEGAQSFGQNDAYTDPFAVPSQSYPDPFAPFADQEEPFTPTPEPVAAEHAHEPPQTTNEQPPAPQREPELVATKSFETVNPQPETPKNGWWKRLIE